MEKKKSSVLLKIGIISGILIIGFIFTKFYPPDILLHNILLHSKMLKNHEDNHLQVYEDENLQKEKESSDSFWSKEQNILPTAESPSGKEKISYKLLFSATLRRNDTLYTCLKRKGISPQKIYLISKSLKSFLNPRNCRPGDRVELQEKENGLMVLKYFPQGLNYYVVEEKEPGVFVAEKKEIPRKKVLIGAKGEVESSLYEAMKKEGISNELILNFADIFSWEIDFLTDPRKGDSFQMIWERYISPEGNVLMEGRILAAQYVNQGKKYTAIFYQDPEGHRGYFTPDGKSLRKSFLRSPLHYRRISSYFSYRRFHPILKIYRPHLGIDYAAPTGTPVSSIGDGVVIFAGWNGGFGKQVKIKHPNGYITSYGHLSRIARGVRRGKKVYQGQVIGYVGATGLATGPHLDFRISKNGRYYNFLKMRLPRAASVKEAYFDDFNKKKILYVYYLDFLTKAKDKVVLLEELPEEKELTS
ncbi:M23 family metallopeptidase [Candidatus Aerophobetes bacterium]|nr:M23 family metallopeptidase [Candidatus Aerophobetes bacterium]